MPVEEGRSHLGCPRHELMLCTFIDCMKNILRVTTSESLVALGMASHNQIQLHFQLELLKCYCVNLLTIVQCKNSVTHTLYIDEINP